MPILAALDSLHVDGGHFEVVKMDIVLLLKENAVGKSVLDLVVDLSLKFRMLPPLEHILERGDTHQDQVGHDVKCRHNDQEPPQLVD